MEVQSVGRGRDFAYDGKACGRRAKFSHALADSNPRRNSSVSTPKPRGDAVCKYWKSGRCAYGDKCRYLHSWSSGDGFTMLAKLEGHKKAVTGIALPWGSDKLYSGSSDGTARTWDCTTGKCADLANLRDEVGSMITEGPWVFIGLNSYIKAFHTQREVEFNLEGPVGKVHAMAIANNMLFAGTQNGDIFAWSGSGDEANPFQLTASLKGHSSAVLCLAVGEKKLFSGSMDNTIRVWDTDTLQCMKTLNGHEDVVMSLLHSNGCLFSCSLDCTIKVWFTTEGQNWETIYTHKEENGVITLCGMDDADGKPVLLCSCNDDTVRLYELPSFTERGRLYSKREVRVIQSGPNGLFFTGDASGSLTVWNWLPKFQG